MNAPHRPESFDPHANYASPNYGPESFDPYGNSPRSHDLSIPINGNSHASYASPTGGTYDTYGGNYGGNYDTDDHHYGNYDTDDYQEEPLHGGIHAGESEGKKTATNLRQNPRL